MSRNTFNFSITLRNQECEVEAEYEPADYSVGIMGDGMAGFQVFDEEQNDITNSLTDEEIKMVEDAGQKILDAGDHHDYPDWDEERDS